MNQALEQQPTPSLVAVQPLLIVEDDAIFARWLTRAVRNYQHSFFDIVHVADLSTAVCQAALQNFSVIFLDLTLPDSSGADTIDCIRRVYPSAHVIVLSGDQDSKMMVEAFEKGVVEYLCKRSMSMQTVFKVLDMLRTSDIFRFNGGVSRGMTLKSSGKSCTQALVLRGKNEKGKGDSSRWNFNH